MKQIKNIIAAVVLILTSSYTAIAQEEITGEKQTLEATFEGFDGEFYTFKFIGEDGEENSIDFDSVDSSVLEVINIKEEKYIGSNFKITFVEEEIKEADEDGSLQTYIEIKIIELNKF